MNPPNARLAPLGEVEFPNAHDAPAFLAQGAIDPLVAGLVGGYLFLSEGAVVPWQVGVLRTAMPKAAIHEHRVPELGKDEIGLAEDRLMTSLAGVQPWAPPRMSRPG